MRFSEQYGIHHVIAAIDGAAGITGDSINFRDVHHACFICSFGALTGTSVLTVKTGASAGTQTTALTFNYRWASAAAGTATADVYGAWATSAALSITDGTYEDFLLIIEVDASEVTAAEPWVTLAVDSTATVILESVICITDGRYAGLTQPTKIT
jgi:hypothetical protein